MELNNEELKSLCIDFTKRLSLGEKGQHVAALFQDNEHNEIIGWAVLDKENNIIDKFEGEDSLNNLFKKYEID